MTARIKPCKHPCCPDQGPCRKAKPRPKRNPIPPFSAKRKKQNAAYSALRKQFLSVNPSCQALLDGCTRIATDVHHMAGRVGINYLNTGDWLAVCRNCHQWIEEHPVEAKEKGLSKSRLKYYDQK